MDLNPATATATELTTALRERRISSRELLAYLLDRAAKLNPELNAIVAWDTERAQAEAAESGEGEEPEEASTTRTRTRSRRGGRGRRSSARSTPLEGTFDHGEEGYGLWLDPAVADDAVYAEYWAGHRPVEVTIEEDQIVIRRAGEKNGSDAD